MTRNDIISIAYQVSLGMTCCNYEKPSLPHGASHNAMDPLTELISSSVQGLKCNIVTKLNLLFILSRKYTTNLNKFQVFVEEFQIISINRYVLLMWRSKATKIWWMFPLTMLFIKLYCHPVPISYTWVLELRQISKVFRWLENNKKYFSEAGEMLFIYQRNYRSYR